MILISAPLPRSPHPPPDALFRFRHLILRPPCFRLSPSHVQPPVLRSVLSSRHKPPLYICIIVRTTFMPHFTCPAFLAFIFRRPLPARLPFRCTFQASASSLKSLFPHLHTGGFMPLYIVYIYSGIGPPFLANVICPFRQMANIHLPSSQAKNPPFAPSGNAFAPDKNSKFARIPLLRQPFCHLPCSASRTPVPTQSSHNPPIYSARNINILM